MDLKTKIELLSNHVTPERLEKIMRISADRTRYLTVVLENIFYTQNMSAVTRTCECLGIQDLYQIGAASQGRLNSDVAKGASCWTDIHRMTKLPIAEAVSQLKAAGYRIIAAMPAPGASSLYDLDLSKGKIAVAMGNESEGTGDEVKALADGFMTIPMYGFTESFNVSVSAAIILSELMNRLRHSDIDWRLPPDELDELRYRWIRRCIKQGDKIEAEYETRLEHPNAQ